MHLGPCFQGLLVQEEFPVPLAVHALAIDGDVGVLGEEAVKGLLEFLARSGFVQCSDVLLTCTTHRPTESLIYRNNQHTGPVRGLDFNSLQNNLLATGAVSGEVRVHWLIAHGPV